MNRVLAHTGARFPIVQAPMGWIARSTLASAVSRAGGLGVIETSSGETENCPAWACGQGSMAVNKAGSSSACCKVRRAATGATREDGSFSITNLK